MSSITIRNGVVTIATPTRQTEVHLSATANTILEGYPIRASKTDLVALATGYLDIEKQLAEMRVELAAARAGTTGPEHAASMQGARKVIAELNKAAGDFMEVYDQGDAPDGVALRDSMGDAEMWLLRDVNACGERVKVLEGGAK